MVIGYWLLTWVMGYGLWVIDMGYGLSTWVMGYGLVVIDMGYCQKYIKNSITYQSL